MASDDERAALTPEPREIPIVRDYVKKEGVQDSRRAFWDMTAEAKAAALDFRRAVKAGDDPGADRISREKGELIALARVTSGLSKVISATRDRVDEINANKDSSLAYKRGAIAQVEKEEKAIYDEFLHAATQASGESTTMRGKVAAP